MARIFGAWLPQSTLTDPKTGRATQTALDWFHGVFIGVRRAPQQLKAIFRENQAAAVATTVIPLGALSAGLYRVTVVERVTQAATSSSSLQSTIGWTRGGASLTNVGTALTGNTTATYGSRTFEIRVDAGSSITYAVAYSSTGATPMQFEIDVRVDLMPVGEQA